MLPLPPLGEEGWGGGGPDRIYVTVLKKACT